HHQQLLEQLRALGQCVPAPGLQARRHQEVAGALGGRAGQRRGLDLDERVLVEHVAGDLVDLAAQPQGGPRARTPQVEVAVPQPGLLADVDVVADRERQRGGGAEHLEAVLRCLRSGQLDLDRAGGDLGVDVVGRALDNGAGDLDAVLVAQVAHRLAVADHDLDGAAGVAQVEEGDPAVIASAGDPAGERHGLADVLRAEAAGVMGADHESSSKVVGTTVGCRSEVGGCHASGSASTWFPSRMSLTWWPSEPPAPVGGNQTYGMPRRSAYRICLPSFCAEAATSAGMPRARRRLATALLRPRV